MNKKNIMLYAIVEMVLMILSIIVIHAVVTFIETRSYAFNVTDLLMVFDKRNIKPLFAVFIGLNMFLFSSIKRLKYKNRYGNKESKWSSRSEISCGYGVKKINIQKDKVKHAGAMLYSNSRRVLVDTTDSHSLYIGQTESGKTTTQILPLIHLLAKANESLVIFDPKGELYKETSGMLKEKEYEVVVINLREPELSDKWNPMHIIWEAAMNDQYDKAVELTDDLCQVIIPRNPKDPVWEDGARGYLKGIILALLEMLNHDEEELFHFKSVANIIISGESGEVPLINTVFDDLFEVTDIPYLSASAVLSSKDKTRASYISTLTSYFNKYIQRNDLMNVLSKSDFDLRTVGSKETAVFLIVQDDKSTYHQIASMFISQLYTSLIDTATKNGGKLEYRVNFLLDEFGNMPRIPNFESIITAARSRRMRFYMVIQAFEQLEKFYDRSGMEIIKGNCKNTFFLMSESEKTLNEFSNKSGTRKILDRRGYEKDEKLIKPIELRTLGMGEVLILRSREMPIKTKFPFITKYRFKNYEPVIIDKSSAEALAVFNLPNYVENELLQDYGDDLMFDMDEVRENKVELKIKQM